MASKPSMYDIDAYIAAGIDPSVITKKLGKSNISSCVSKSDIKKQLRIVDEQDAVNRFKWFNLPKGLNSRLIERVLYYKGQGMFFFMKDKFYFLPYALDGTIDVYGRFTSVTPLPFNGTTNDGKVKPLIKGLIYEPQYDIILPEDFEGKSDSEIKSFMESSCVLLKDYTEQISQTNISRQILNDPILDVMAECFPFMRTALLNSTGTSGMRVLTESDYTNVIAANSALTKAALEGTRFVPIIGEIDFQELSKGQTIKSEEFLLAMQSLDNYRLSLYGLENGGLFQKKAHKLQAEQETNQNNSALILLDSLNNRQEFCNIVNSIFGLNIWCDISDLALIKEEDKEENQYTSEEEVFNETEETEEDQTDDVPTE